MKLLQAFLIITLAILIHISMQSPATSDASMLELESSVLQATPPALQAALDLPADTLQQRFHRAVWNDEPAAIKQLIALGADINHIDPEDGYAALHWAVERKLMGTIKILLENEADVNLLTKNAIGNDRTALHIAAELGHTEIVALLLEAGADIHKKTVFGESPLHGVRLFVKNPEVITLLIEHGADVNAATQFGTTPLHAAALLGSSEIVALLIENGAAVDSPDRRGQTPLHHAAQHGHTNVIEQLFAVNVDINAQTRTGDTAMHLAAKKGHPGVIQLLLEQGANPMTLNKSSKSPLSEAQERSNDRVIELLSGATVPEQEG